MCSRPADAGLTLGLAAPARPTDASMTEPRPTAPAAVIALDHLVLAAGSLELGCAWLKRRFGVAPEGGGSHPGFGTHNRLMRLGHGAYLELIAPDPGQPAPPDGRPFGLDLPGQHERLSVRPRLVHFVLRTDRLEAAATLLGLDMHAPLAMQRGELRWSIVLRPFGGNPTDGLEPSLIDWGDTRPPGDTLPESGVALTALHVCAPTAICRRLAPLGALDRRIRLHDDRVPMLAAEFRTPRGWAIVD